MRPGNTAVGSGCGFVDLRHTRQISPGLTKGEITRAGFRNGTQTDRLVLDHHTIATVVACFLVGEVEFQAHLLNVGSIPSLRLCGTVKRGTAPVFEVRIAHLLSANGKWQHHHRRDYRHILEKCSHITYYLFDFFVFRVQKSPFFIGCKITAFLSSTQ